jgi:putative phosphoribosyl transferase
MEVTSDIPNVPVAKDAEAVQIPITAADVHAKVSGISVDDDNTSIFTDASCIRGDLVTPYHCNHATVVFCHGSGSSRQSARNRYASHAFQRAGFTTLLFDLLTAEEAKQDDITREHRFDIPLLAQRVIAVHAWLKTHHAELVQRGVILFGASTGKFVN